MFNILLNNKFTNSSTAKELQKTLLERDRSTAKGWLYTNNNCIQAVTTMQTEEVLEILADFSKDKFYDLYLIEHGELLEPTNKEVNWITKGYKISGGLYEYLGTDKGYFSLPVYE